MFAAALLILTVAATVHLLRPPASATSPDAGFFGGPGTCCLDYP
jgi:hypothetical protein